MDRDRMGRAVAVIPDGPARELRAAAGEGWVEQGDMGVGWSRSFHWGDRAWELARDLLSSLPAGPAPFIVGTSAWDPATRWWAQPYCQDAHVLTPVLRPNGAIYFTG